MSEFITMDPEALQAIGYLARAYMDVVTRLARIEADKAGRDHVTVDDVADVIEDAADLMLATARDLPPA